MGLKAESSNVVVEGVGGIYNVFATGSKAPFSRITVRRRKNGEGWFVSIKNLTNTGVIEVGCDTVKPKKTLTLEKVSGCDGFSFTLTLWNITFRLLAKRPSR